MSPLRRLGGLWMIVRRSLRQHLLSSVVTVVSTALASGLVMSVFSLSAQTERAFTGGPVGFDAVLGARGSQLQLVLNSVFHLETSPGNIPWGLYRAVAEKRGVELAIPYAVGDHYRGFRVVGSTAQVFSDFEYATGKRFEMQGQGRAFDPERREAVIGATVALETGLRRGDEFHPAHGVVDGGKEHHEDYVVVGVLRPTNSPSDRVIWVPIEGLFRMGGHVLRGDGEEFHAEPGEEIPDEHKEVSAVMLKFASPVVGMGLHKMINLDRKDATLAYPIGTVMADLFRKLGWVNRVLELVAYLVVLVAAASILASIYNTMNERRREFAILRSLGARRRTVFSVIVMESTTIAALGSVCGFVVYAGILGLAAVVVREQTGVVLSLTAFHASLVATPVGMVVLGALAGLLPAFKAYSTDVAANLVPTS